MSFKEEVLQTARAACDQLPGWKFTNASGYQQIISKTLRQEIDPGFTFQGGPDPSASIQPHVQIKSKVFDLAYKELFGEAPRWSSFISVNNQLEGYLSTRVYRNRFEINGRPWPDPDLDPVPWMR